MTKTVKKTSISIQPHTARILERNKYLPDRSARINQIIERYDMLIVQEREGLAPLVADSFLGFVIGEWLEAYPIQLGLPTIVNTVYQERKFDGLEVPDEAEFNKLMEELKSLTFTQQLALTEIIEAQLA